MSTPFNYQDALSVSSALLSQQPDTTNPNPQPQAHPVLHAFEKAVKKSPGVAGATALNDVLGGVEKFALRPAGGLMAEHGVNPAGLPVVSTLIDMGNLLRHPIGTFTDPNHYRPTDISLNVANPQNVQGVQQADSLTGKYNAALAGHPFEKFTYEMAANPLNYIGAGLGETLAARIAEAINTPELANPVALQMVHNLGDARALDWANALAHWDKRIGDVQSLPFTAAGKGLRAASDAVGLSPLLAKGVATAKSAIPSIEGTALKSTLDRVGVMRLLDQMSMVPSKAWQIIGKDSPSDPTELLSGYRGVKNTAQRASYLETVDDKVLTDARDAARDAILQGKKSVGPYAAENKSFLKNFEKTLTDELTNRGSRGLSYSNTVTPDKLGEWLDGIDSSSLTRTQKLKALGDLTNEGLAEAANLAHAQGKTKLTKLITDNAGWRGLIVNPLEKTVRPYQGMALDRGAEDLAHYLVSLPPATRTAVLDHESPYSLAGVYQRLQPIIQSGNANEDVAKGFASIMDYFRNRGWLDGQDNLIPKYASHARLEQALRENGNNSLGERMAWHNAIDAIAQDFPNNRNFAAFKTPEDVYNRFNVKSFTQAVPHVTDDIINSLPYAARMETRNGLQDIGKAAQGIVNGAYDPQTGVVHIGQLADVSTAAHEILGHWFDANLTPDAQRRVLRDLGVKIGNYDTPTREMLAEGVDAVVRGTDPAKAQGIWKTLLEDFQKYGQEAELPAAHPGSAMESQLLGNKPRIYSPKNPIPAPGAGPQDVLFQKGAAGYNWAIDANPGTMLTLADENIPGFSMNNLEELVNNALDHAETGSGFQLEQNASGWIHNAYDGKNLFQLQHQLTQDQKDLISSLVDKEVNLYQKTHPPVDPSTLNFPPGSVTPASTTSKAAINDAADKIGDELLFGANPISIADVDHVKVIGVGFNKFAAIPVAHDGTELTPVAFTLAGLDSYDGPAIEKVLNDTYDFGLKGGSSAAQSAAEKSAFQKMFAKIQSELYSVGTSPDEVVSIELAKTSTGHLEADIETAGDNFSLHLGDAASLDQKTLEQWNTALETYFGAFGNPAPTISVSTAPKFKQTWKAGQIISPGIYNPVENYAGMFATNDAHMVAVVFDGGVHMWEPGVGFSAVDLKDSKDLFDFAEQYDVPILHLSQAVKKGGDWQEASDWMNRAFSEYEDTVARAANPKQMSKSAAEVFHGANDGVTPEGYTPGTDPQYTTKYGYEQQFDKAINDYFPRLENVVETHPTYDPLQNQRRFSQMLGDFADRLSRDESRAIDKYKSYNYQAINQFLRTGDTKIFAIRPQDRIQNGMTAEQAAVIVKHIDSAFEKAPPLPETLTTFRAAQPLTDLQTLSGLLPGEIGIERGYASTSFTMLDHFLNKGFDFSGRPLVLEVEIPAGMKAISTIPDSVEHDMEYEVLLPRDTIFEVVTDPTLVRVAHGGSQYEVPYIKVRALAPDAKADYDVLFQKVNPNLTNLLDQATQPLRQPVKDMSNLPVDAPLAKALQRVATEHGIDYQDMKPVQAILQPFADANELHFNVSDLWQFPKVNQLLVDAARAGDEDTRRQLVARAVQLLNDDHAAWGIRHPGGFGAALGNIIPERSKMTSTKITDAFTKGWLPGGDISAKDIATWEKAQAAPGVRRAIAVFEKETNDLADMVAKAGINNPLWGVDEMFTKSEIDAANKAGLFSDEEAQLANDYFDKWGFNRETTIGNKINNAKVNERQEKVSRVIVDEYEKHLRRELGIKFDQNQAWWAKSARWASRAWRESALMSAATFVANTADMAIRMSLHTINPLVSKNSAFRSFLAWGVDTLPEDLRGTFRAAMEGDVQGSALGKIPLAGRVLDPVVNFFYSLLNWQDSTGRVAVARWAIRDHLQDQILPRLLLATDRVGAADGMNPTEVAALKREIVRNPRGVDFGADQLHRLILQRGGSENMATELSRSWQQGINEGMERGSELAKQIHLDFNRKMQLEDSLHLRGIFGFHTFAIRNIPFYLQTAVENPWLVRAMIDYRRMTDEERQRAGLSKSYVDKFALPTSFAAFLVPFLGAGTLYFNPTSALSIMSQFKDPNVPSNEPLVGKGLTLLGNTGLRLAPWVDLPLHALGVYGTEEPYGLIRQGSLLSGTKLDLNPTVRVTDAVRNALPWNQKVYTNTGSSYKDYLVNRQIELLATQAMGNSPQSQQVASLAMADPSSPLYQQALYDVNVDQFRHGVYSFLSPFPYARVSPQEATLRASAPPSGLSPEVLATLRALGVPMPLSGIPDNSVSANIGAAYTAKDMVSPVFSAARAGAASNYPDYDRYQAWLKTRGPNEDHSVRAFLASPASHR